MIEYIVKDNLIYFGLKEKLLDEIQWYYSLNEVKIKDKVNGFLLHIITQNRGFNYFMYHNGEFLKAKYLEYDVFKEMERSEKINTILDNDKLG